VPTADATTPLLPPLQLIQTEGLSAKRAAKPSTLLRDYYFYPMGAVAPGPCAICIHAVTHPVPPVACLHACRQIDICLPATACTLPDCRPTVGPVKLHPA
jgi:hypothetical protein